MSDPRRCLQVRFSSIHCANFSEVAPSKKQYLSLGGFPGEKAQQNQELEHIICTVKEMLKVSRAMNCNFKAYLTLKLISLFSPFIEQTCVSANTTNCLQNLSHTKIKFTFNIRLPTSLYTYKRK